MFNGTNPTRGIRRSLLAVAALAALAAAGCGGDDDEPTLTKTQVIEQGGAVCKKAEQAVKELPALSSKHPFAKGSPVKERRRARAFLSGYARLLDSSRHGLAKLKAPDEDRQLLDGYLGDTGRVVAGLKAASRAPDAEVEDMANEAFALFEQASSQTADYGFPPGVCGAGNS